MGRFSETLNAISGFVWGPVMIILLVGTGLYLTIRLGFIQIRFFGHALKCVSGKYDDPAESGDITHFQALSSALAATIGTGNIAGVATAIAMGGPGAVFWMWITALVGMATKYSSCSLALKFRRLHPDGSASGGPMYYLEKGLNLKWLGVLFALFAMLASFGIGCAVQSHSVADGLLSMLPESFHHSVKVPFFGMTPWAAIVIGAAIAFLVGIVTIGGIRRIARVAERVVPVMCVFYVVAALVVLILNVTEIPKAFGQIFHYAFTPLAAGGGFIGQVLAMTIRLGVSRGVFSNEAGLGSAPIAHAAAKTHEMAREGMVAMLGPFIDTIVICTMTALVIIISGAWQVRDENGNVLYGPGGSGVPTSITLKVDGEDQAKTVIGSVADDPNPYRRRDGSYYEPPNGSPLTASAFEQELPSPGGVPLGRWVVVLGLVFFAYTTMIAWSYYGDRSCEYLFGERAVLPYRYLFCGFAFIGPLGGLDAIWTMADILNALMAVPNLIALLALGGVVQKETRDYINRMRQSGDIR